MNCTICSLLLVSILDTEANVRKWVCPSEAYHFCSAMDHTNPANPQPYRQVRDKRTTVRV